MNRPNEGNPFVFFVQFIISTEERINRVVILYTKQRIQGFTMQSDLIKSTPVYRLLKGFSLMKYIRNILVIHLHSLLFINSFFTTGWALQRKMNERSLKELSFFLNSCSFSNIVIYASLLTLKSCPHKLEPCRLLKQSVANVKRSLYGKVSLSFLGNSQLVIYY